MLEIGYFVFCQSVEFRSTGKGDASVTVLNPISVLSPMFIPGGFSFSVSFNMYGFVEADQGRRLEVKLVSPDNKIACMAETVVPPGMTEKGDLPQEYRSAVINMDLVNVPILMEGFYSAQILFDGELINTFRIPAFPSYAKERSE